MLSPSVPFRETNFNNLFLLRVAPAACIRVLDLLGFLLGIAGIRDIAFLRPDACICDKEMMIEDNGY